MELFLTCKNVENIIKWAKPSWQKSEEDSKLKLHEHQTPDLWFLPMFKCERSRNVKEGYRRSFPITGLTFQVRKGGRGGEVACRIIVPAPVPVPFLWTLDLRLWTWILDLDLGLRTWTWTWQLEYFWLYSLGSIISSLLLNKVSLA